MYKLNEEKMFYDVADNVAIVINYTTGVYYSFNQFGSSILDHLLAGENEAKIIEDANKINGCPDNIGIVIKDFIEKLKAKEILVEAAGDPVFSDLSPITAADDFVPEFDEFTEMQDLILADPIHEVNPDQGWPFVK